MRRGMRTESALCSFGCAPNIVPERQPARRALGVPDRRLRASDPGRSRELARLPLCALYASAEPAFCAIGHQQRVCAPLAVRDRQRDLPHEMARRSLTPRTVGRWEQIAAIALGRDRRPWRPTPARCCYSGGRSCPDRTSSSLRPSAPGSCQTHSPRRRRSPRR